MEDYLQRFSAPGAAATEKYLRGMGFPIVRRSEPLQDGGVADLVAYRIDEQGLLMPEVAVMLSDDSSIETLTRLKELADGLKASYALLVVKEQQYYWIKPKQSIFPMDSPAPVQTRATHLLVEQDLLEKGAFLTEKLLDTLDPFAQIYLVTAALLLQDGLAREGRLKELEGKLTANSYLGMLKETEMPSGLENRLYGYLDKLGTAALHRFVRDMREFPPAGAGLGEGLLKVALKMLFRPFEGVPRDMLEEHLSEASLQVLLDFYQEAVSLYPGAREGRALVGNGYDVYFVLDAIAATDRVAMGLGVLLYFFNGKLLQYHKGGCNFDKASAAAEVSWLAQSMLRLCGKGHGEVRTGDILSLEAAGQYSLVTIFSPAGPMVKAEDYSRFASVKKKSGMIDIGQLLLEKCLTLARPGGLACACVSKGLLTNLASRPVRELILEQAFVEAVIDFPPPLLLLRRKEAGVGEPAKVFLANPSTERQLQVVAGAFIRWKKGEDVQA